MFYKVSFGLVALFFLSVLGLCSRFLVYTGDLPETKHLSEFAPTRGHLATDSCLAGLSFAIPFDRIGKTFQDAFASAESGISLSDQIARTLMCHRHESMARYQLDALRLSWLIRRRFSEQQQFAIYVNRAYFGPGATGVQNASEHLFQKDADALSPEEAALLAGLLRAPDALSPFKYPDRALQRRNKVLQAMAVQGKLGSVEVAEAVGRPIIIRSRGNTEEEALPRGVLEALAEDESEYCDQFEDDFKKGCEEAFQVNLMWIQLQVVPRGVPAILVENKNIRFCGSAGCPLKLFIIQPNGHFVQALETDGDVGSLAEVRVLKSVTDGHYDIQKTWADGRTHTIYRWRGSRYFAH